MAATLEFFPVDNGDMALITLESGRRILIDINIRQAADDEEHDTPDVGQELRDRLDRDDKGRLFVDAFLLTHPDADHCRGLETHFHLGAPGNWSKKDDKIFIRDMWSSPIIFRRKDRCGDLCEDAQAWRDEARRRVNLYKASSSKKMEDGDRILVLGEDVDGKTDGLDPILIRIDETITRICGVTDGTFSALLLAPLPPDDDEEEEDTLAKNRSSVILRTKITADGNPNACRYLAGGDAEVAIWERLWGRHKNKTDNLMYDILLSPHHCSWHSLSYDSWSEMGEDAEVSKDARSALSQARTDATIIASSKPIEDDDDDPPCIRAKREYESIVEEVNGTFTCVMETESGDPEVLTFEIGSDGPKPSGGGGGGSSAKVFGSASSPQVKKKGSTRYA